MGGLGLLLYTQAVTMFEIFLGGRQPRVAGLGVPVLRVVAFALPALATINILGGALRGAGDTRWPWVIVLFGYLVVRLPLTYLLATPATSGGLGWGLYGAWIAMFADLHVRGALVAARFLHGGWKQTYV
jgi:Na+-driven multidrug efflux pump